MVSTRAVMSTQTKASWWSQYAVIKLKERSCPFSSESVSRLLRLPQEDFFITEGRDTHWWWPHCVILSRTISLHPLRSLASWRGSWNLMFRQDRIWFDHLLRLRPLWYSRMLYACTRYSLSKLVNSSRIKSCYLQNENKQYSHLK